MKTIADLQSQLVETQNKVIKLKAQRDKIDKQIAILEGTTAPKKKRFKRESAPKRVKNKQSLTTIIKKIMADNKTHTIKNIVKSVKKYNYKTNSASLYACVAAALVRGPFQKIERGVYQLEKEAAILDNSNVTVVSEVAEPQNV